uniref:Uncharacterized protein n=1 Tax=Romanomermis culicivorax TaxID=13658 RepID=A0A915HVN5_ROMCU
MICISTLREDFFKQQIQQQQLQAAGLVPPGMAGAFGGPHPGFPPTSSLPPAALPPGFLPPLPPGVKDEKPNNNSLNLMNNDENRHSQNRHSVSPSVSRPNRSRSPQDGVVDKRRRKMDNGDSDDNKSNDDLVVDVQNEDPISPANGAKSSPENANSSGGGVGSSGGGAGTNNHHGVNLIRKPKVERSDSPRSNASSAGGRSSPGAARKEVRKMIEKFEELFL